MTIMAAMRDASWFRRPGRARRYHVLKRGCSACGVYALFVEETKLPANEVPPALRCRRPGCRQAFEKAEAQLPAPTPAHKQDTHSFPPKGFTPAANAYFQNVAASKMPLPDSWYKQEKKKG
jgi:hypothetical protein